MVVLERVMTLFLSKNYLGQNEKFAFLLDQNYHEPFQMTLLIKTRHDVVNVPITTFLM